MARTWENRGSGVQSVGEEPNVVNRKLPKPVSFFTTEERWDLVRRVALVLESSGVELEAGGQTGVLNDWFVNEMRAYTQRKLEAAGLSKAAIRHEMEKLK